MKKNKKLKKMIGIIGVATIGSATLSGCDFEAIYNQQMIMYGPAPIPNNEIKPNKFIPEDNLVEAMYGVIQNDYNVITPPIENDTPEFNIEENYENEVYGSQKEPNTLEFFKDDYLPQMNPAVYGPKQNN